MSRSAGPIPPDLVTRARALGDSVVELVVEAYERGGVTRSSDAFAQALDACLAQRRELAERLVDLDAEAIVALEQRYERMKPSASVAAYFDGATEAVQACCARLAKFDDTSGDDDAQ